MATHITIPGEPDAIAYKTNTRRQIGIARRALRDAGIESAPVYAGEPDGLGESYKNGQVLFAAPGRPRVTNARTTPLQLKVSEAEMASIRERATAAGQTIAQWVRERLG